jgi:DeoR family transcriptional regulator of aga operon
MSAPLPARVRRDRIVAELSEAEFVRVSDLAHHFEVSEVTIRADLDALGERGLLRRVRGGAVPRPTTPA